MTAIAAQNPGRPASHAAGSSVVGQSPPTRTADCAAMLSSVVSLAAMKLTTAVHSEQESAAAKARTAEKMKAFMVV